MEERNMGIMADTENLFKDAFSEEMNSVNVQISHSAIDCKYGTTSCTQNHINESRPQRHSLVPSSINMYLYLLTVSYNGKKAWPR